LVFDEPTAVLTPQETDELIAIMRQLRDAGTAIVFITHKLREVREVADRITVIRLGKVVGEAEPTASNVELASLMVGRSVELTVQREPSEGGEVGLQVSGLSVLDPAGQVVVDGVDFVVRRGEILAIAGVQGNGQTELTEALLGLQDDVRGTVTLDGKVLTGASVRQVLDAGVGFVPEDRQEDALVAEFSIAENLMLDRSDGAPFVKGGAVQRRDLESFAAATVKEFDVRAQGIDTHVGRLSGGNQQKVVLARALSVTPRVFMLDEPTRGVDVGAKVEVYTLIGELAAAGAAILIVSSDMLELLGLCDRIGVMRAGRLAGEVARRDFSQDRIMSLAAIG
ncbi:ATP-binding cassette domain-containing protein, partial [Jatrophihabitans endophyticus]|uniref:ATP-binding cassette domain-containing protein n=1 Tax=Jatrophihabitans endophyticus TaxID=1206085 RepID=UPI0019FED85D